MSELYINRNMWLYREGKLEPICDPIVAEAELKVVVNGREIVRMACSPRDLNELAVGYLLAEGLLLDFDDIKSIEQQGECTVNLEITRALSPVRDERPRVINTCMGQGRAAQDAKDGSSSRQPGYQVAFKAKHLLKMVSDLDEKAETFKKTGGVHSAGLGSAGQLLARYEDIGRHNAVDKVFGYAFLNRISLDDKCLVLSGRIAGEILMKAVCNRVPLVVSRSAPTLKSVEMAEQMGITIVGFARGARFNIYTHPERIVP